MLRNTALYAFARVAPAAINFFALALYSRLLDRATYGRYALLIASVSLGGAIGYHWLRLGLIRFLGSQEESRDAFLSTLMRAFVGVSALAGIVAAVLWWSLDDPAMRILVPLGLVLMWAQCAFDLNLDISVARLRPLRYASVTAARAALGVGSAALLVWRGYGLPGIVIGLVIGCVVPLFAGSGLPWRRCWSIPMDRMLLIQLVRYGAPLIATVSLEFIVNASDRFLLGLMNGAEAVGMYAVGYDLSQQSLTVLMVTVNLAAWPAVLAALKQGGGAARSALTQQATLLACVGLPVAAGLAMLAPNVAHVVLGARFQESARALIPLISVAALLAGLKSYYFDLSFQIRSATTNQLWIMLGAAGANVVCNLVWIPRFGVFGAAWATIVAYGVGLAASWWRGRAVFPMPVPWTAWGRIAAATGVMAIVLWPLREMTGLAALVAQVSAGALAFVAVAVMLNVLTTRDRLRVLVARRGTGSV